MYSNLREIHGWEDVWLASNGVYLFRQDTLEAGKGNSIILAENCHQQWEGVKKGGATSEEGLSQLSWKRI